MSSVLFCICISFVLTSCSHCRGVPDPEPVIAPQPPPSDLRRPEESRGVINPKTGEYLQPSGKGVINPRTGDYYFPSGNGYFNPKTGEFIPKKP